MADRVKSAARPLLRALTGAICEVETAPFRRAAPGSVLSLKGLRRFLGATRRPAVGVCGRTWAGAIQYSACIRASIRAQIRAPHLGPAVARPIPYQLVRSSGGGNDKPCPTPAPAGFDNERIRRWRLRPPPGAGRAGPAARRRGGRGFVPAGRRGVPRGAATRSLRGPGAANLP